MLYKAKNREGKLNLPEDKALITTLFYFDIVHWSDNEVDEHAKRDLYIESWLCDKLKIARNKEEYDQILKEDEEEIKKANDYVR